MTVEHIGIQLTEACNATCGHCGTSSSPAVRHRFGKEFLSYVLAEVATLGRIEVGFTGGEPLMEPDLLFHGIAETRRLGLTYGVTTNGFWGKAPKRRGEVLRAIKDCKSLGFSLDRFHADFINETAVLETVREADAEGIPVAVRYTLAANECEAEVAGRLLRAVPASVPIHFGPLMPVGRRKTLDAALFPLETSEIPCGAASVPTITASGAVYACCGESLYLGDSPLMLGRLPEDRLTVITERRARSLDVMALRTLGPVRLAREVDGGRGNFPAHFARTQCGSCQILFGTQQAINRSSTVLEDLRSKIVATAALFYGELL